MAEKLAVTSKHVGVIRFAGDLQKAADSLHVKIDLFLKKLTLDLFNLIVMDTPVDTGRARASWHVAIGTPNLDVPPEIPEKDRAEREKEKRAGGSPGIHSMFSQYEGQPPLPPVIQEIDGRQVIYITSNLVYIEALEHGHSGQAPHGMVALNVAAMETSVAVAIKAAQQGG